MGVITESFANLTDQLLSHYKPEAKSSQAVDQFIAYALRPLLPASVRIGTGTVMDIRERQVGPLDIVASTDNFPPFGHGASSAYAIDGVIFVIQARNWAQTDLSEFGQMATQIKKLERKTKNPPACLAVSYAPMPLPDINSFLTGANGREVDGILCLGHHIVMRNALGIYGNPDKVPFVTQRPGPEALKAFSFYLLHLSQLATKQTFGLADYQHL